MNLLLFSLLFSLFFSISVCTLRRDNRLSGGEREDEPGGRGNYSDQLLHRIDDESAMCHDASIFIYRAAAVELRFALPSAIRSSRSGRARLRTFVHVMIVVMLVEIDV